MTTETGHPARGAFLEELKRTCEDEGQGALSPCGSVANASLGGQVCF
ncbi:hypothetical protein [Amycolatopsis anabasis]|nr:hypothetical protein [Amycolatopsis anabasis]